jgi:hypothetical protein
MLQVKDRATPTIGVTRRVGEPRRETQDEAAATGSRLGRRRAETFALRDLRHLSIFSLLWTGYVWVHVAGAITLFGRP